MHFLRFLSLLACFSVIDSLPILMPLRDLPTGDSAVSVVESMLSSGFSPLFAYTSRPQSSGTPVLTPSIPNTSPPPSLQTSSPLFTIPGTPLPTDLPPVSVPVDMPPPPPSQIPPSSVAPSLIQPTPGAPLPTDVPSVTVPVDPQQPTQPPVASVKPMYTSIPSPPQACLAKAAALSASAASPTGGSLLATNPNLVAGRQVLVKRIAQKDLHQVAQSWQDLCFASGGDTVTNDPCVQLAGINGINALLADADNCDQQDNADAMIDFAKSKGITNANALIANAIAYRMHPRNAVNMQGTIPSTPYCQKPPRNQELLGVVNNQLPGLNPYVFGGTTVGMVPFGDPSSCPYGQTPNVNTCSCA